MAYHLKSGEPVAAGIKRMAKEELQSAADQLSGKAGATRDEAIHEARKSIKKVRGVLRLMRRELGASYQEESAQLRVIGRTLSEFRDAGAIIETFDSLKQKFGDELGRRSLASIRHGLIRRKEEAEEEANLDQVLRQMAASLRAAGKRVKMWPLKNAGFKAMAPGLEQTYRRGQQALASAQKHPSPPSYHQWRKRVKDHWYHVRLLENIWTDVMLAYEKSLKDVETWLGEDHNLAVLREKIDAEPRFYGNKKDIAFVLDRIGKFQKELRDNAVSLGERAYEDKPRQFTLHMKHLWEAWQEQPKSLEEAQKLENHAQRKQQTRPVRAQRAKVAAA